MWFRNTVLLALVLDKSAAQLVLRPDQSSPVTQHKRPRETEGSAEVECTWTSDRHCRETRQLEESCGAGYQFEVWIFASSGDWSGVTVERANVLGLDVERTWTTQSTLPVIFSRSLRRALAIAVLSFALRAHACSGNWSCARTVQRTNVLVCFLLFYPYEQNGVTSKKPASEKIKSGSNQRKALHSQWIWRFRWGPNRPTSTQSNSKTNCLAENQTGDWASRYCWRLRGPQHWTLRRGKWQCWPLSANFV